MNKNRNEKEVTANTTDIQRIIRDYYEQLYTNKMDSLEEMDKFLRNAKSPKTEPGRNRKYEQINC